MGQCWSIAFLSLRCSGTEMMYRSLSHQTRFLAKVDRAVLGGLCSYPRHVNAIQGRTSRPALDRASSFTISITGRLFTNSVPGGLKKHPRNYRSRGKDLYWEAQSGLGAVDKGYPQQN